MKHPLILLMIVFPLGILSAQESKWFRTTMESIDGSSSLPDNEKIELLGSLLPIGTNDVRKFRMDGEQRIVLKRIQDELLPIPGHAEYWVEPIIEAKTWRMRLLNEPTYTASPPKLFEHPNGLGLKFMALSQLPSPETVKVLCEFTADDKDVDEWIEKKKTAKGLERERLDISAPLAIEAVMALHVLPLKSKPPVWWEGDGTYAFFFEWRNWCRQILEGRRTFSFEGDPNEYSLDGPVTVAKNPDIPRPSKRSAPAADGTSGTDAPMSRAPWIVAAIAALAAGGGWFFLKKQKGI